jgi:hypothetical protein
MKYVLMFNVEDELSKEHRWVYLIDGEWGYTLYIVQQGVMPGDVMVFDKVTDIYQWLEDNVNWKGHPWYYKVSENTDLRVVAVKPHMVQQGWEEV